MRKLITLSIVTAALAVSACKKTETAANATDANAMVAEMNEEDALEGTTNDSMTNIDASMGSGDGVDVANGADTNASDTSSATPAPAANSAGNKAE